MVALRTLVVFLPLACAPADSNARKAASVRQAAQDSVATAVISPEGGTVELEGVAVVIFPAGAFDASQLVTVLTTNTPATEAGRVTWEVSVALPAPLPYDVRINSGDVAPGTEFEAVLTVPDSYLNSLPTDHTPQVFAQMVEGGPHEDLDLYRVLASDFDPQAKVVRAQVPLRAVRLPRLDDGTIEVILLVASAPVGR